MFLKIVIFFLIMIFIIGSYVSQAEQVQWGIVGLIAIVVGIILYSVNSESK